MLFSADPNKVTCIYKVQCILIGASMSGVEGVEREASDVKE